VSEAEVEQKKIFLPISEYFYSIQGEGITAGTPSVFLRLGGCNLNCKFCDTLSVWQKSKPIEIGKLVRRFENEGLLYYLQRGAHFVITGGEPLIHQEALIPFLYELTIFTAKDVFVEVETNGTILPQKAFDRYVSLYNVSPKLSNSGMEEEKRINAKALEFFSSSSKAYFKFVVSSEEDVAELVKDFKLPFSIPSNKILLMPLSSSREEYISNSKKVVELCKKFNFRFSPRLQLEIWDRTVGV
jgi:6-pyruvoyltetrahydropterin 2'-reductase